jgi:hypothetical protein
MGKELKFSNIFLKFLFMIISVKKMTGRMAYCNYVFKSIRFLTISCQVFSGVNFSKIT